MIPQLKNMLSRYSLKERKKIMNSTYQANSLAVENAQKTVSTPTGANYEIDSSHSAAHFSVRHLMISNVKGEFSKVTGTVVYDPNNWRNADRCDDRRDHDQHTR